MQWIGFVVVGGMLLGLFILAAWFLLGGLVAGQMLNRKRHRCDGVERPEDRGFDTKRFWIPVDDQHRLNAWLIRPPDRHDALPVVVMVHGFSSHKDCLWTFPDQPDYAGSMLDQGADTLCSAGFCVVAIDLRNHGESDTHGHVTLGQDEADDVVATLTYLRSNSVDLGIDPDRIGLRGESMGAVTCMIAVAKLSSFLDDRAAGSVKAMWCDSPFASAHRVVGDFMAYAGIDRRLAAPVRFWLNRMTGRDFRRSSPNEYAHQISCPAMIVHSEDDPMIGIDHFEELQSLSWAKPPDFWRLRGHGHNRLWKEPGYHQRQVEFFTGHLIERR